MSSDPRRRAMPDAATKGTCPVIGVSVPILGVGRCPTPPLLNCLLTVKRSSSVASAHLGMLVGARSGGGSGGSLPVGVGPLQGYRISGAVQSGSRQRPSVTTWLLCGSRNR